MPRHTYGHKGQLLVLRHAGKWTIRGFVFVAPAWLSEPAPSIHPRPAGRAKAALRKRTTPAPKAEVALGHPLLQQERQWSKA